MKSALFPNGEIWFIASQNHKPDFDSSLLTNQNLKFRYKKNFYFVSTFNIRAWSLKSCHCRRRRENCKSWNFLLTCICNAKLWFPITYKKPSTHSKQIPSHLFSDVYGLRFHNTIGFHFKNSKWLCGMAKKSDFA